MLQRFNMPTHTIPMLSKKPKAATADLHKDLLGTRNPGLGYMAKRAQPVLYDADTLLHPTHHPVSIWDSEEVLVHQVVSMKKMNEKPGHVRPENGFYEKLNALKFVPQQELSREQAYWLPANEIASQASNPDRPVTPFIHTRPPPSQVLANLQKVNAVFHQFEGIINERTTQKPLYVSEWCFDYAKQFVEQQLVPFYEHFKNHIQSANETIFREVKEYEQIFDDLDAEYERCVLDNKNLTIEKKNLLIKNDCLIAECLEKDICSIVLTSDIVVPPSSNCLCEDLRSACDREHTKVLELEAEISKQKQLITESEKHTSSASNAIFEINKLRQQLQGKDDTIRNLDAQINIMKVLNVGSTKGSCDQQALETDRIQLKDTITSLRIQLDSLKVESVSLKRRYDELSQANTHSRTAYTEKTKLKSQVTGTTRSGPSPLSSRKQIVLWTQDITYFSVGQFVMRFRSCIPTAFRVTSATTIWWTSSIVCLLTKASSTKSWLWHRRLNHLNFGTLNELARNNLVRGLPMLKYNKDHLCPSCQLGKSKKASHPLKTVNTNIEVLHTLHMDLCGPMRTESINGKKYVLVIVDDYTRFGWRVLVFLMKRAYLGLHNRTALSKDVNELLLEAARTCIFAKAPLFLWAEAVATALKRNLIYKLPSVCIHCATLPIDYDDTLVNSRRDGHIGYTFFGYATHQEGVDDLFQWFDDDEVVPIPPVVPITPVNVPAAPAPENAIGSPSTTVISEGAPAVTESLLPHQIPLPDTSDSDVETLFDHVDRRQVIDLKKSFAPVARLKKRSRHFIAQRSEASSAIVYRSRKLSIALNNSTYVYDNNQRSNQVSDIYKRRGRILHSSREKQANIFYWIAISQIPEGICYQQSNRRRYLEKVLVLTMHTIELPWRSGPTLDEDKGKLSLQKYTLQAMDIMTHGISIQFPAQFSWTLHRLVCWYHPKKQKKYCHHESTTEAELHRQSDAVLKSSGCDLNYETMDYAFNNKFRRSPGAEGLFLRIHRLQITCLGPEEPERHTFTIYVTICSRSLFTQSFYRGRCLRLREQPDYLVAASPTSGDIEEDDEEDPEEDPADYPTDRGDDDDDDDAEEEEYLVSADPVAVAYSADQDPYLAYRVTARMSIRPRAPAPFLSEEVAKRFLALPTPPPSPLSLYSSPLPQIPSPPLPIPSQPPNSPTHVEGSL
ncbi:retrovirus-related pol polyprotein from transposon TNT 1-94 [Tanacetum coccineum]